MSNFYDNLNLSGNLSINNSSTGNTLYINQLGSGNAVLIEDSTSPDATPFIIDSSGNVNIGRVEYLETSGGNKAKLQVNNSTSTIPFSGLPFNTNFIVQGFNQNSVGLFTTDINHSQIYFGTPSDVFGSNIRWDYSNRLLNIATQNTGGTITLSSGENNETIRLLPNGNVGINNDSPSERLDVSGNTKISGSLNIGTILGNTPIINLGLDSSGNVVTGTTGGGTFTGNTSGDCITDLYVTNLYGCSPITINDSIQSISSSATGTTSFAFGNNVKAYGNYSHAEGISTTASGNYSHAEGYQTTASGYYSHAEGNGTTSIGDFSHSEGYLTTVLGNGSHAEGYGTIAMGDYQHVSGLWNLTGNTQGAFIIGNGIDNSNRSNLMFAEGNEVNIYGQALVSGSGQNILTVIGSGDTSPLFTVQGSSGELFSVTDNLIGSLFSVNDISGLPILEVFSDDTILMGSFQAPSLNTTVRLNPSIGQTTVYSIPISAYTGVWFEYTVKNTSGVRAGQIMSVFSGTSVQSNQTTTSSIGSTTPISFTVTSDGTNASLKVSATTSGWEVKTIVRSI